MRSIKRFLPKSDLYEYFAYCAQDFLIFALFSYILYAFLPKIKWMVIFLFLITVLNILYISKMGYPITLGLVSQAGDFLFIQTSIQSPSIYRNIGILGGVTFFMAFFFLITERLSKLSKLLRSMLTFINFLLIIFSMTMFLVKGELLNGRYYKNILVSFASPPLTIKEILKSDHFLGLKPSRWERENNKTDSIKKKLNIVLVVMETLSFELEKELAGEKVFPNILKMASSSRRYTNHLTSWPFSSKSLYSLICGVYPAPTSIIEMRINKKGLCKSWLSELINTHGYSGLTSYSGNLNYDNMRGFFKGIAPMDLVDRNQLDLLKNFPSNKLSVDDLSMIKNFKSWNKEPFVATFITMNSHFPYWTPRKEFEKFKNPYWNSMHYQDYLVGELEKLLEEKGLSQNTIIVITGDHGKRIGQGSDEMLPKTMFQVPLIIKIPGEQGSVITKVTNHADIGSSLYRELTGRYFGLKKMNLEAQKSSFVFFETSETIFSLISNKEKLVLKNNGLIYRNESQWPKMTDPICDKKSCLDKFNEFYINLENLKEIYDL